MLKSALLLQLPLTHVVMPFYTTLYEFTLMWSHSSD